MDHPWYMRFIDVILGLFFVGLISLLYSRYYGRNVKNTRFEVFLNGKLQATEVSQENMDSFKRAFEHYESIYDDNGSKESSVSNGIDTESLDNRLRSLDCREKWFVSMKHTDSSYGFRMIESLLPIIHMEFASIIDQLEYVINVYKLYLKESGKVIESNDPILSTLEEFKNELSRKDRESSSVISAKVPAFMKTGVKLRDRWDISLYMPGSETNDENIKGYPFECHHILVLESILTWCSNNVDKKNRYTDVPACHLLRKGWENDYAIRQIYKNSHFKLLKHIEFLVSLEVENDKSRSLIYNDRVMNERKIEVFDQQIELVLEILSTFYSGIKSRDLDLEESISNLKRNVSNGKESYLQGMKFMDLEGNRSRVCDLLFNDPSGEKEDKKITLSYRYVYLLKGLVSWSKESIRNKNAKFKLYWKRGKSSFVLHEDESVIENDQEWEDLKVRIGDDLFKYDRFLVSLERDRIENNYRLGYDGRTKGTVHDIEGDIGIFRKQLDLLANLTNKFCRKILPGNTELQEMMSLLRENTLNTMNADIVKPVAIAEAIMDNDQDDPNNNMGDSMTNDII